MTTIEDVRALELLDSRGNPTVGAVVTLMGGASGMAAVPSGAAPELTKPSSCAMEADATSVRAS